MCENMLVCVDGGPGHSLPVMFWFMLFIWRDTCVNSQFSNGTSFYPALTLVMIGGGGLYVPTIFYLFFY